MEKLKSAFDMFFSGIILVSVESLEPRICLLYEVRFFLQRMSSSGGNMYTSSYLMVWKGVEI